jgi:tetratricopeptide (TPR) repeat protein
MMRAAWILVVAAAWCAVAWAQEAPETAARRERQAAIETDAGLSERGRAVLFRARSRQDEGDWDGAVRAVSAWLAGGAGRAHHLLEFNLGVSQLALDRPDSARVAFARAVELEPAFARGWLRLGEAAYESGRFATAAEAFARAHGLLPDPPDEILHYAGVCRLQAGDAAGACDVLEPLVARSADAPLTWYRSLAAAALEAGTPERARRALDRLVSTRGSEPEVWDLAWRVAAAGGDHRDAAVLLKAEGFLASLERRDWEQLGDLFAAAGVPLEAARAWQRALEMAGPGESSRVDDVVRLARAWLAAHRTAEARAVLEQALASRGDDADLLALLGDVLLTAEDTAGASAAYARTRRRGGCT